MNARNAPESGLACRTRFSHGETSGRCGNPREEQSVCHAGVTDSFLPESGISVEGEVVSGWVGKEGGPCAKTDVGTQPLK